MVYINIYLEAFIKSNYINANDYINLHISDEPLPYTKILFLQSKKDPITEAKNKRFHLLKGP